MDSLFVLGSLALVMLMQPGFGCLETGLVRTKNGTDVAMKNLADFVLSCLCYPMIGFALMFGPTIGGVIGAPSFAAPTGGFDLVFLLFQVAFAGTATTIVSGAAAERMKFWAYAQLSVIVSALIYPVVGHWAWSGRFGAPGWLVQLGFVDFAGSTVVHIVGGAVSLAVVQAIGPRIGRFEDKNVVEAHSLQMSVLGTFLLWIGWLGFNGGSALTFGENVGTIVQATLLGGAGGGTLGMVWSMATLRRPDVPSLINGLLGGLVGITAGCHLYTAEVAVVVGAIGGLCAIVATDALERLRIDDAVGAVPVHLAGGCWGTLAVALFGSPALGTVPSLGVQALGAASAGLFAWSAGRLACAVVARTSGLRVTPAEEFIGLNYAEHGAGSQVLDLLVQMEQHGRGEGWSPVRADAHSDIGRVGLGYNQLMRRVAEREASLFEAAAAAQVALDEAVISARARTEFLDRMSHELRTPLNAVIGYSELLEDGSVDEESRGYIQSITRSGHHLLGLVGSLLDVVKVESEALTLRPQPCDVHQVIRELAAGFSSRCQVRGVGLHVDVPLTFPSLSLDVERLRQALSPILDNAVRFTEAGTVTVRASLRAGRDGDRLEIAVRDTGPGIEAQKMERIFELFEQGDGSARRRHDGAGIGLSLSRKLARVMGGDVRATSKVGEGSEFLLTVAAEPVAAAPVASA
jgi:Amt family ammonium transporter